MVQHIADLSSISVDECPLLSPRLSLMLPHCLHHLSHWLQDTCTDIHTTHFLQIDQD